MVTGASRGIGLAIAAQLAKEDYSLVLPLRPTANYDELEKILTNLNARYEIVWLDLLNSKDIFNFTQNWNKRLWGLINNAGVCKVSYLEDSFFEDPWSDVLQINLTAPYVLTKGLIGRIEQPGRIINISSQLGLEGRAGYSAYCASKFSLIGLTKVWAKELGKHKVTVNAICPGWVSTEMSLLDVCRLANEAGIPDSDYMKNISEPLELRRFNTPLEVANLVEFLLSEKASGITGREFLMQTIWNQL